MRNRDIYQKDPSRQKLVNQGVANVNDERSDEALSVLRYELETFVCDGQYEKGLAHILDTYLKNIEQAQQPAVWVSGFYGSGKSHLVKMLRALWMDTRFPDGASARGLAALPESVRDNLKELSTCAARHGGLHAASGTLGASSRDRSVRMALLGIVFRSVGLPEQYPLARFVMRLRQEGILEAVREQVARAGFDWQEELDNFYVAEGLHGALVALKPDKFASVQSCVETLNNLYPYVRDISNNEMLKALRQALEQGGKFPLTLVVLDEVQQFIGEDSQRSIDVQEVVETCSKDIGGKLLFIGTGQTAVTGTPNLKKLEGRFTVRVELSDADVDAVIRQVILAKKPGAREPVEAVMQTNLGEVSRHLAGTGIGHRPDDMPTFSQDYPILPVRRRFWENTLRVLDQTGTDSQLRNQLSMIHRVIQTNLDEPLGHVVAADHLYFEAADKLLQSRILPRKVHEYTLRWREGDEDQRLLARACGLVFLINKLAGGNRDIHIRATVDSVADLLVEDLTRGSSALRARLPGLLDGCELLMRVGEEYRIQTEESAAWSDEFLSQRASLANEAHRVETERDDRIRRMFGELVRNLSLVQGSAAVAREVSTVFDARLPADAARRVIVWVRDGWSIDENSVKVEARQAGSQAPTVFVFIPRRSADDLRHHLIDFKAASATLDKRGVPNSPEGTEARAAMETTRQTAEGRIRELLQEAFSGAHVFQGGGNEIVAGSLREAVLEAANNALQRLYPQFAVADHAGWSKVYERAHRGVPDALKSVDDEGEPAKNPVCKAILGFIAGGKSGTEIRQQFESAPFGWSRDTVDGGLQVLLIAGLVRVQDERAQALEPRELERKSIGKAVFRVEATTISTPQRIQIRKLLQKLDLGARQGEELTQVPAFLQKLLELAASAGGEPPRPANPDTAPLEAIRLTAGNAQLMALYNQREFLTTCIAEWTGLRESIRARLPHWQMLEKLCQYGAGLADIEVLQAQVDTVRSQRQLLAEPDPVAPLLGHLTQLLRDELNRLAADYETGHREGMARLAADGNWQALDPAQRHGLLAEQRLTIADAPAVNVGTTEAVSSTLAEITLSAFADRVAALPGRFDGVLRGAAALLEPETQFVKLPRSTIRDEAELEAWLEQARATIAEALEQGPVSLG